jgi:glycosyltransferase involved in cell wall biosynthesis
MGAPRVRVNVFGKQSTNAAQRIEALLLQPHPTPHRESLFCEIEHLSGGSVRICYLAEVSQRRPWLQPVRKRDYEPLFLSRDLLETRNRRVGIGRVISVLRDVRPRVVISGYEHPEYWAAHVWARAHGVRTICWLGTTGDEGANRIKNLLRALFLRRFDDFILYSNLTRNYMTSVGLPSHHSRVVPNATEATAFRLPQEAYAKRRATMREHLGIPADAFVVLSAGRLAPEKNLGVVLAGVAQARKLLPETVRSRLRLVVVGSGPCASSLSEDCQRLGLSDVSIRRDGVPQDRLPDFFAAADVFVLMSKWEPWGIVANEAAAMGLPLIISEQCGAACHLFPGELSEWVLPPHDAALLGERIARLASDPQLLVSVSSLFREAERPFTVDSMARTLLRAAEVPFS